MMEDTKRKIEVMKAYAEGKPIQVKACGVSEWRDCTLEPDWDWVSGDYRVKPEDKYRPYKDYHEMAEDFCDRFGLNYPSYAMPSYAMPLIWLKAKRTDYKLLISSFTGGDESWKLMKTYFEMYMYLDGSPVGKKAEE